MSHSASRLAELKRELAEIKGLMAYAAQLVVQLTETGNRFQATMRECGGLVPNARVKPEDCHKAGRTGGSVPSAKSAPIIRIEAGPADDEA